LSRSLLSRQGQCFASAGHLSWAKCGQRAWL